MIIKEIKARKIFNSRNEPTIEVVVKTDKSKKGVGSAPSGASKGKNEVVAISPKGIDFSIEFINKVMCARLKNFEFTKFDDLKRVESMLRKYDKSENWSKIGGNTIIALEFAILNTHGIDLWKFLNPKSHRLPRPLGNCVGGGAHTKRRATDFQEFLIFAPTSRTFLDAAKANKYIYDLVKQTFRRKKISFGKTDEGALAPNLTNTEVLDLLTEVTDKARDKLGFNIKLGLDIAASQLWDGRRYVYKNFSTKKKNTSLSSLEHYEFILDIIRKYRLAYVEDPFHENDFSNFAQLNSKVQCLLCGDDLVCTNKKLLAKAVKYKALNTIIVKPNQIGSLIRTKEIIDFARRHDIIPVISHRSGETLDATISHLAVAWSIPLIKCGIVGKERLAKINETIAIEKRFSI